MSIRILVMWWAGEVFLRGSTKTSANGQIIFSPVEVRVSTLERRARKDPE
jgi:hypothetical protein